MKINLTIMKNKRQAILFLLCLVLSACGTAENESSEAEDLYDKFLNGEWYVGDTDIYYYITPTNEPDRRYVTDYIIMDSTGDGIPELHLRTAREYTIFSCVEDEIIIVQSFFTNPWEYSLTNRGAFIFHADRGTTLGDFYRYFEMDSVGNPINEVTFEWTDINENLICDENDEFIYDNHSCTKEEWDQQTKEYLFTDEAGRYQIRDQVEWIRYTLPPDLQETENDPQYYGDRDDGWAFCCTAG